MTEFKLNRRALLTGASAAVSAAALAVAIIPSVSADDVAVVEIDPAMRYERAVAELKAAALAMRPDLDVWTINRTDMGVLVWGYSSVEAAKPLTVKWDGDGVYETIQGDTRPCWHITREPRYDHGVERWFSLSTGFKGKLEPADWSCSERNLPVLTRKIRPLA